MDYKATWDLLKEHITEHISDLKDLIDNELISEGSKEYAKGSLDTCKMVIAMMTGVETMYKED